jgi:hypothetical protein
MCSGSHFGKLSEAAFLRALSEAARPPVDSGANLSHDDTPVPAEVREIASSGTAARDHLEVCRHLTRDHLRPRALEVRAGHRDATD